MSADYWLEMDTGGTEPCRITDPSFNITYNLGPMLRAAGFPDWDALIGAPASETAGVLNSVAAKLRTDQAELTEKYSPENGWGDWHRALEFIQRFRDACAAHPKATIGGWL